MKSKDEIIRMYVSWETSGFEYWSKVRGLSIILWEHPYHITSLSSIKFSVSSHSSPSSV